jgi:hypothetical protein
MLDERGDGDQREQHGENGRKMYDGDVRPVGDHGSHSWFGFPTAKGRLEARLRRYWPYNLYG